MLQKILGKTSKKKTKLRNIGQVSQKWLNDVGIFTLKELEKIGAEKAFKKVQKVGIEPSINLLYSLIGTIYDQDWKIVADTMKKKKN